MKKVIIAIAVALMAAASVFADGPEWESDLDDFVASHYGESQEWTYFSAISHPCATKKRAKIRAEETLREEVADNIGGKITKSLKKTENSDFVEDDEGEAGPSIDITATMKFSVQIDCPAFDFLKYYYEETDVEGKTYYICYVLARYRTGDMVKKVQKLNVEKQVAAWAKDYGKKNRTTVSEETKEFIISSVKEDIEGYIENPYDDFEDEDDYEEDE